MTFKLHWLGTRGSILPTGPVASGISSIFQNYWTAHKVKNFPTADIWNIFNTVRDINISGENNVLMCMCGCVCVGGYVHMCALVQMCETKQILP